MGLISLVPTTVAIEFAASWSPFRKSNPSATTMRPISSGRASWCTSGVVDDDAVDFVRHVLERVGDPLQMLVDFAGDDELHRLLRILLKCSLEADCVGVVGPALQPNDLLGDHVDLRTV